MDDHKDDLSEDAEDPVFASLEEAVAHMNEHVLPELVDHRFFVAQLRNLGWTPDQMHRRYPSLPLRICKTLLARRAVLDDYGYIWNLH